MATVPVPELGPSAEERLRVEVAELKRKLADSEKSADRAWVRVKELESRIQQVRGILR